jgi:glyoxylase-like metal-dependent hydrolase (beta-lactamase superfamily II)
MKLHVLNTGFFKLDGGAMFGVVPKTIWQKTNPADENNMCTWAMRCLLIEDGKKLILIDTGIGNKQEDKFFAHYYLHGTDNLENSLKTKGFTTDDITDVFLTHLHFDHCGGAINYNTDRSKLFPAFKNAIYWSNPAHWDWATNPNPREKASFLKENILPIHESGQLKMVNPSEKSPFEQFDIWYVDGHTEKMMLPVINYKNTKVVYMADMLPSVGHIPLPYVMGYDTRPLITLQEKAEILKNIQENNYTMFLEHDSVNECATLINTEKGIRLSNTFSLNEL